MDHGRVSVQQRVDNVTDQDGWTSPALLSYVRALIFVAELPVLFLCLSVDKRHNRFVVARRIVDSLGLYTQAFAALLLRAAFEEPDGEDDDQDRCFDMDLSPWFMIRCEWTEILPPITPMAMPATRAVLVGHFISTRLISSENEETTRSRGKGWRTGRRNTSHSLETRQAWSWICTSFLSPWSWSSSRHPSRRQ